MSKFSGPWFLGNRIDGRTSLYDSQDESADAVAWVEGSPEITRLIAAAPEMYAGLKWAMGILDAHFPCDSACTDACSNHRYRALLARIDGGSDE